MITNPKTISLEECRAIITSAQKRFPRLTLHGDGIIHDEHEVFALKDEKYLSAVQSAINYCLQLYPTWRRPLTVEELAAKIEESVTGKRLDVPNGIVIAAALHVGLAVEPLGRGRFGRDILVIFKDHNSRKDSAI